MIDMLTYVTVLVKDQDEALQYYTEKLNFEKRQDVTIGNGFRWLVVAPKQHSETGLVLFKAGSDEEKKAVGNQTGGRIPLFVFATDDCQQTFEALKAKGVKFLDAPMKNPWGIAVQFLDLYGNKFELLQRVQN